MNCYNMCSLVTPESYAPKKNGGSAKGRSHTKNGGKGKERRARFLRAVRGGGCDGSDGRGGEGEGNFV